MSLSRAFRRGPPVEQLVVEGIVHPHAKNVIPHPTVYGHQGAAFRSSKHVVSTLAEDLLGALAPTTAAGPRFPSHRSSVPGSRPAVPRSPIASPRRFAAATADGAVLGPGQVENRFGMTGAKDCKHRLERGFVKIRLDMTGCPSFNDET